MLFVVVVVYTPLAFVVVVVVVVLSSFLFALPFCSLLDGYILVGIGYHHRHE